MLSGRGPGGRQKERQPSGSSPVTSPQLAAASLTVSLERLGDLVRSPPRSGSCRGRQGGGGDRCALRPGGSRRGLGERPGRGGTPGGRGRRARCPGAPGSLSSRQRPSVTPPRLPTEPGNGPRRWKPSWQRQKTRRGPCEARSTRQPASTLARSRPSCRPTALSLPKPVRVGRRKWPWRLPAGPRPKGRRSRRGPSWPVPGGT